MSDVTVTSPIDEIAGVHPVTSPSRPARSVWSLLGQMALKVLGVVVSIAVVLGAWQLFLTLFHVNHFSDLGYGFWLAVVVTGGLLYASLRASQGQTIMPSRPAT